MKRVFIFAALAFALCITAVLIGSTNSSKEICKEPSNKAVCAMSSAQAMNSATCPMAAKSNELKACQRVTEKACKTADCSKCDNVCPKGEACLNKDTCEKRAACPNKDNCSKKTE